MADATDHADLRIRVHAQEGGEYVATTALRDGRVIRVVGCLYDGSRHREVSREDVVDLMKQWIRWLRRDSFS